jgi:PEP-CTERM motif-containing protein
MRFLVRTGGLTQSPPVPGGSEILDFTQFNPTLGTLTGVEVVGTGTVGLAFSNIGACGPISNTLTPQIGSASLTAVTNSVDLGSGTFCSPTIYTGGGSTIFSVAAPGLLSDYIGTSTAPITFSYSVTTLGEQGSDSATWSGDAHLEYTFTPASATVPEPSSIALMLLGVGLLFVMRKRIGQGLPQAS